MTGPNKIPLTDEAVAVVGCRVCGEGPLVAVLDFAEQPACDYFPAVDDPRPDPRWPLTLALCSPCGLVQLNHISPVPEPPRAVESRTMLAHADAVGKRIAVRTGLPTGSTALELASHHGGSWTGSLAAQGLLVIETGLADLVVDNHSIIHEENTDGAFADRAAHVAPGGWLAIEFHHALSQVTEGQFDTIRHGHPVYLSLSALDRLARRHGLLVVDAWPEPVYGGCLVALMRRSADLPTGGSAAQSAGAAMILEQEKAAHLDQPSGYANLTLQARRACTDLRTHLERAQRSSRRVLAYGAGSKACTLLCVAGIDVDLLAAVADLAPDKHGRRMPGTSIPVISPSELVARRPDEVLVLTWDIAPEIVAQLHDMGLTGVDFVVPMPVLEQIESPG